MQITIQARSERNLERWRELLADREPARLPHRIETDRLGRIIMTPPPFFEHVWRIARIIELLHELLPAGKTLSETPLSTADGVKVMDVAWLNSGYAKALEQERPLVLEEAPQICIEVLSASNTDEEISEKRTLYFEAGAAEVWICGLDGQMSFYTASSEGKSASELCSQFPLRI